MDTNCHGCRKSSQSPTFQTKNILKIFKILRQVILIKNILIKDGVTTSGSRQIVREDGDSISISHLRSVYILLELKEDWTRVQESRKKYKRDRKIIDSTHVQLLS